jgi:hypothetical protein
MVKLRNVLSRQFDIKEGVRQGDPLPCLLLSKAHEALLGGFVRKVFRICGAVQIDCVWQRCYIRKYIVYLMMWIYLKN